MLHSLLLTFAVWKVLAVVFCDKCTTKIDINSHFELIWIFSRDEERAWKEGSWSVFRSRMFHQWLFSKTSQWTGLGLSKTEKEVITIFIIYVWFQTLGHEDYKKKHTLLLSSSIIESGRFSYNSKGFEIFSLGDICCCLNVMIIGISCWKLSRSNKMLAALEDVQRCFELLILA